MGADPFPGRATVGAPLQGRPVSGPGPFLRSAWGRCASGGDAEVELGAGLGAQAPMLVGVVRLASHGEVPGVVLAAGPVVVGRVDVVDLCRSGAADLAAARRTRAGSGACGVPDVRLVESAGTPVGAPCGRASGGDGLTVPLAPMLVVGAVSENASRRARQRLTVIDGRGAVHVLQHIPTEVVRKRRIGISSTACGGGARARRRAAAVAGDGSGALLRARSPARAPAGRRSGRSGRRSGGGSCGRTRRPRRSRGVVRNRGGA